MGVAAVAPTPFYILRSFLTEPTTQGVPTPSLTVITKEGESFLSQFLGKQDGVPHSQCF